MEKTPHYPLQELLFTSSDKGVAARLARLLKKGEVKKLAPRIYTTNLTDQPEFIMRRNWYRVVSELYKGAILSHRSAIECRPTTPGGHLYLTYTYTKNIHLPGLIIHFQEGHTAIEGDNPFFGELYLSQEARAFLENFEQSRKHGEKSKILPQDELEAKLESIIRVRGDEALNTLRDRARQIAPELGLQTAFKKLNKVIGSLLSTRPITNLSSPVAMARALGEPFDPARIALFDKLYDGLVAGVFPDYANKNTTVKAYQNFAFFEGYFSNYIEGTVLAIEDAKQVIATEIPLPAQNEDSHDVLGTYKLVSDMREMARCPKTREELIQILFYRHGVLLSARHTKKPGQFKDINNRAGDTEFVNWDLVTGTLKKGFELYSLLQHPFAKAAYMMFMISEIHPFLDGNGRMARVMMNAELSSQGLTKIMIPTVYREDYMGTLRKLTRQGDTDSYIRMLTRAYTFSATVFGESQDDMEAYLRACNAFKEPGDGMLKWEF